MALLFVFMDYTSFISFLDLRRPLVFLCGPAIHDETTDRRCILKKYINREWKRINVIDNKDYVNAYPFIVDSLFNPDEINAKGLDIKINVVEEIISNIAYKTYIFLDTMSTSYELGQFTNYAYDKNDVTVFLDRGYQDRVNNVVGEYINKSLSHKYVLYDATYNNRMHISFPKGRRGKLTIPREIVEVLKSDNPVINNTNTIPPLFFSNLEEDVNNIGTIVYKKENNKLSFSFSIKNLFYFVASVYRRVRESNAISLREIPNSVDDISFVDFLSTLKRELLTTFVVKNNKDRNYGFILTHDYETTIKVGTFNSCELIYHMLYVIYMLMEYGGNSGYPVASMKRLSSGYSFSNSVIDLLHIQNSHIKSVLNKWESNLVERNNSVKVNRYKIKGKYREIVSYSNNHFGNQLRYLHKMIFDSLLYILPSSKASFAYKKGCNCLDCISEHEGNTYFAKFDIHHFFESIKLSNVKYKISKYINNQYETRLIKNYNSTKVRAAIFKDLSSLVKPLFLNYKLPIGFSTSPKVSDFYLYEMDECMSKLEGITYTRYADDILLSSNDKLLFDTAINELKNHLKNESLAINDSKTRYQSLKNVNDSFRFLGINIVKRENNKYEYTISKSFIVDTSKMCCQYIMQKTEDRCIGDLQKIEGKLNYIKSVSERCYRKTLNLIEHKLHRNDKYGFPVEIIKYF